MRAPCIPTVPQLLLHSRALTAALSARAFASFVPCSRLCLLLPPDTRAILLLLFLIPLALLHAFMPAFRVLLIVSSLPCFLTLLFPVIGLAAPSEPALLASSHFYARGIV